MKKTYNKQIVTQITYELWFDDEDMLEEESEPKTHPLSIIMPLLTFGVLSSTDCGLHSFTGR